MKPFPSRLSRRLYPWIGVASLLAGCGNSSAGAKPSDAGAGEPLSDGASVGKGPGGGSSDGGDAGSSVCVHGAFPSPDIYDPSCNFDVAEYRKIAASYGAGDGLRYRFGADSTYFHDGGLSVPEQVRAPDKFCVTDNNNGFDYQIGDACDPTNPGNYSSDEGVVTYQAAVFDDGDGGSGAGGGVDAIQIERWGYETVTERPQATDALTYPAYATQLRQSQWTTLNGGPVRSPVYQARGIAPEFGQTSGGAFIAFNDGLIGTVGTNTDSGGYVTKLPDGLVPTSLGITNGNEFAIFTVWDTAAVKSELAVFAMESDHKGFGDFEDQFYDFHTHLSGFPNTGSVTMMKLIGMVDLPDMIAPTDIAVASNFQAAFFRDQSDGNTAPADVDLTQEPVWETFTTPADGGVNFNSYQRSTGGFAVVISRSEHKATFVDLQPLFDAFNAVYFTDFTTFQATQSQWGLAANQWPLPFDQAWPAPFDKAPSAKPVVISTITLPDVPTAVFAGRHGDLDSSKSIHALIATIDGTMHIYDVGGLIDSSAASASAIKEIGTLDVGKNPTQIAGRKPAGQGTDIDPVTGEMGSPMAHDVLIVARGDRAVSIVKVIGGTATIVKTLQDTALLDPVAVDDADREVFSSFLMSVVDMGGKQVLNYRYGPVTFPDATMKTYGMGADGGAPWELGGTYAVQGTPFAFTGTNTP